MKQAGIAKLVGTNSNWFCAIVNGRADAGKELGDALNNLVGGGMELWTLDKNREKRKPLINEYLAAFKAARKVVAK